MDRTRLAPYQERLVGSGVRLTPQRFMVLAALAAHPGHTTADQILATVQIQYPHVNKTTVYRTLELLAELGMVAISQMGGNQATYELLEAPHHHLICKRCGVMRELPDAALNPCASSWRPNTASSPAWSILVSLASAATAGPPTPRPPCPTLSLKDGAPSRRVTSLPTVAGTIRDQQPDRAAPVGGGSTRRPAHTELGGGSTRRPAHTECGMALGNG